MDGADGRSWRGLQRRPVGVGFFNSRPQLAKLAEAEKYPMWLSDSGAVFATKAVVVPPLLPRGRKLHTGEEQMEGRHLDADGCLLSVRNGEATYGAGLQ